MHKTPCCIYCQKAFYEKSAIRFIHQNNFVRSRLYHEGEDEFRRSCFWLYGSRYLLLDISRVNTL